MSYVIVAVPLFSSFAFAWQSTAISEAIQLLPLYSMALQKNVAFRGGADVRADERASVHSQLANMPIEHSRCFTYPSMFRCPTRFVFVFLLVGVRSSFSCKYFAFSVFVEGNCRTG